MARGKKTIVLAGYLVRFPLGGYAWQVAHYLLGFRALGYEVWFYEDTAYYAPAYNPHTGEFGPSYTYGIAAAARFLDSLGLGQHWGFVDAARHVAYGPAAERLPRLLGEADLFVNLGGVHAIPPEHRRRRPTIYIDLDPVYTQLQLASGDANLRALLEAHTHLFTFGENIGTPHSPTPTGGYTWYPTRQPVSLELWDHAYSPGCAYSTIGRWNAQGRDLIYQGAILQWTKRTEWMRCLALPQRTGATFEVAMDVESVAGDPELLARHGWHVVAPLRVSTEPWDYRAYICRSRGEFSVAKEMYVRLYSGWFSDRTACYLAAGRPAVVQDSGFGNTIALGPGLQAFQSVDEAARAIQEIEADYPRASKHARAVAQEYFAAASVLTQLLHVVGL
ncbi:MAG: hypothetical protein AB7N91_09575 [Candidatus Tectimicrobiota bacterium]